MAGRLPTNIEECTLGKADRLNISMHKMLKKVLFSNDISRLNAYERKSYSVLATELFDAAKKSVHASGCAKECSQAD